MALRCHGCGTCRAYCPVYRVTKDELATPRAKANLDMARGQMLDWCQQQGVAAVDLTDRLGGHVYDDFTHLKDVRGNRVIVDAVQRWVAGGTQLVRQLAAAPQASWAVKRTN